MSDTRFLIRQFGYGYDDECYFVEGSAVSSVHDDRATAEREFRQHELAFLRDDMMLSEHGNFWNDSASRMVRADKFVFEKSGKHLFSNWQELETDVGNNGDMGCGEEATLPKGMSDDDILEFGRLAGVRGHELVELGESASVHVLWDPREDAPVTECTEGGEYLIYAESREAAAAAVDERTEDHGWDDVELAGTAADLSESPALLDKLVETTSGLSWSKKGDELRIRDSHEPAVINALNGLLRVPFFELREVELPMLLELEAREGDEYEDD